MSGFLNFLREHVMLTEIDVHNLITNLLALSDRPGTPHEGEVALAKAKELAKKYGMDLDFIRDQMRRHGVATKRTSQASAHPADQLFIDINLIAKHIPGMRPKGEIHKGNHKFSAFGTEVVVWGLSHNGVLIILLLPMVGETEHPTMWYLLVNHFNGPATKDDVIAKSTNAQDIFNAIRSVDWAGIKAKQEQDQKDKENLAYNNAQKLTPEAQAIVNVGEKYGYVLKANAHLSSWREMFNEPYRIEVGPDGQWTHATRQGDVATGKWKYDTRRFDQKNKGPQTLEKWITTKRKSGEAAFSKHDEINKVVKVLSHYGFKPEDKHGNQHVWTNRTTGFQVTFGPNKLRGAITKTDEIWWMIAGVWVRKATPGGGMQQQHDVKSILGDKSHGNTAEELEDSLSKLMKRAEIGFDKVLVVLQKFEFVPGSEGIERPDNLQEYFVSKGKRYYVSVNPKNGKWSIIKSLRGNGLPGLQSMVSKSGHTADELDHELTRLKGLPHDPLNSPFD